MKPPIVVPCDLCGEDVELPGTPDPAEAIYCQQCGEEAEPADCAPRDRHDAEYLFTPPTVARIADGADAFEVML